MSSDLYKLFYKAVSDDDVEQVKNLVNNEEVDVNYQFPDHDLKTAAHFAATQRNLTMLKILVELKADLNLSDRFNQVPIENAGCHFNYVAIKYLLAQVPAHAEKVKEHINDGPEIDEFFEAVQGKDVDKVRQMLKDGILNVNTPNKSYHNHTALHTACDNECIEMVKMLVDEFKADLEVENNAEETPFDISYGDEISEFLMSRGCKRN